MHRVSGGRAALLAMAAFVFGSVATVGAATSDAWITTKAKMSLLTTEGVSSNAVNVDTIDGQVTLHGNVPTSAEKAKAETTIKKITGVKSVRNLLQVVPPSKEDAVQANDDEVRTRAETALQDAGMNKNVSVQSVHNGVVLLKGNVDTLSEHLRAIEAVSRVAGVKRVASEIKSPDKLADREIYSDKPEEQAQNGKVSDLWVTSAVKLRLMADERTPGLGVNVDTTAGEVTLFGVVASEAAKAAAEEDARKVSGVTTVRNELQVVPKAQQERVQAQDDDVKRRVENTIKLHREFGSDIGVDVKNGVARLTGTVPSQEDRIRAASAVRATSGVRAVEDDLRVSSK